MLQAIIFDLNGVFIQSDLLSDRFNKDYGVNNLDFISALKEVMPQVRRPNAPKCYDLFKPYLKKWKVELTEEEFFDYWFSGEKINPEFMDYAQKLKENNHKVFVLSNNFKERTTYYRQKFSDLLSIIDRAYFSWETGFVKPSPQAYLHILEDNGLKSGECLYFDDSEKNVLAAQKLGITSHKYVGINETKRIISLESR